MPDVAASIDDSEPPSPRKHDRIPVRPPFGKDSATDQVHAARDLLCTCDRDCLPHEFIPHLTLVYGDHRGRYGEWRERMVEGLEGAELDVIVEDLWIAGFPAGGHPARDLVYRLPVPLDTRGL